MSILVGSARIDENGKSHGGTAGDQTGKEVSTQAWYSYPWDYMAIHPTASVREKHAACCEAACANSKIGYDQYQRNTLHPLAKAAGYDYSKITTACECDCSALQNSLAVASGADATYGSNGWTTSNMLKNLINAGYIIIAKSTSISGYSSLTAAQKKSVIVGSKYLLSSAYCVRGAIYVKASAHTVCGLNNGGSYAATLEAAGVSPSSSSSSSTSGSSSSKSTTLQTAKKKDSSLAGTYKTTTALNLRYGPDADDYASMVVMPSGTKVKCYGYYSLNGTTKWLYVVATVSGKQYTGFCSISYLKKQ